MKGNLKVLGGSSMSKMCPVTKRCALNLNLTKINVAEKVQGTGGWRMAYPPLCVLRKEHQR